MKTCWGALPWAREGLLVTHDTYKFLDLFPSILSHPRKPFQVKPNFSIRTIVWARCRHDGRGVPSPGQASHHQSFQILLRFLVELIFFYWTATTTANVACSRFISVRSDAGCVGKLGPKNQKPRQEPTKQGRLAETWVDPFYLTHFH